VFQIQAAYCLQCLQRLFLYLLAVPTQVEGAKGHVIINPGHKELIIRILKDHAYPAPDIVYGISGDNDITDIHRPLGREKIPVYLEEQGRFARAISPHQTYGFTMQDGK